MGPPGVVGADPFSDDTRGVLLNFVAVAMHALLLQRSDQTLNHTVLMRAVRRDEHPPKTITAHHPSKSARSEDRTVIRPQYERPIDASASTETRYQRLHQHHRCRSSSVASRHLRTVTTRPDTAQTVAQRSFGFVASEGSPSTRGRCPIALLRTYKPISWKTL